MDVPLSLMAVLALVAANGFFVATEFSLVAVRRTRVEQLAAGGDGSARSVLDALNHLDTYIAATQLGITMASLALGWIGEPALAHLFEPFILAIPFLSPEARSVASHTLSATIAFIVITALHIVLGELAPKSLALQRSEATALFVTRPIHWFLFVFRLPIFALNSLGNWVVRLFGIQPAAGHALVQSAEELKLAIHASREAGLVSEQEQEVVGRALDFGNWAAHHVMVPRTEIVALPHDVTLDRVVATVQSHQHSRYPVFEGNLDNIIGIATAKRLLGVAGDSARGAAGFDIRAHLSEPLFVPETMRASVLLAEMKRHRSHIAIAIDEYGATAGLVTLGDLIARIAGEVPDEAEGASPELQWQADGSVLVGGLTLLSDLETEMGVHFGASDVDTVGGYVFSRLGRRPLIGDVARVDGYALTVEEVDGLRVARVRAIKEDDEAARERPPEPAPGRPSERSG
jgi:CBS domain containing-hemolysin-like protein